MSYDWLGRPKMPQPQAQPRFLPQLQPEPQDAAQWAAPPVLLHPTPLPPNVDQLSWSERRYWIKMRNEQMKVIKLMEKAAKDQQKAQEKERKLRLKAEEKQRKRELKSVPSLCASEDRVPADGHLLPQGERAGLEMDAQEPISPSPHPLPLCRTDRPRPRQTCRPSGIRATQLYAQFDRRGIWSPTTSECARSAQDSRRAAWTGWLANDEPHHDPCSVFSLFRDF